jgi:hypothetical protein
MSSALPCGALDDVEQDDVAQFFARGDVGERAADHSDTARPEHVVEQHDAAFAKQLEAALVVAIIASFIGVDETKVILARLPRFDARVERFSRGCELQFDDIVDLRISPIATRLRRPLFGDVAGEQFGADWMKVLHRQRNSGRGIAGENADLEHALGVQHAREDLHERALLGADLHLRIGHASGFGAAPSERWMFNWIYVRQIADDFGRKAK